MNWLRAIGTELFGLFVDDVAFAVAIVIWLAVCGVVLPHLSLPSFLPPVILFGGLVLILARSAMRRATGA